MSILRKKLLTICFLILLSFFINGPVQAYVLQGLHLLDLMVKQLGEAQSLFVSQELIFYRSVSQVEIDSDESVEDDQTLDNTVIELQAEEKIEVDENVLVEETLELEETLRFDFSSNAFRSDAKSFDSERIHVVSRDRSLTIVDGNIVPAVANRFDLYKDIFLYRTRDGLAEKLLELGVDVSVSSLGRFEGEIAFVLGAVYPDESVSQIWIDRETFLPTRWIIRGNGGSSESDVLEVRYLTWWKSGSSRYPSRIEFYQDGKLVRVNQIKSFREGDGFSEDLFDIEHLRSVYPLAPEQPLVPGEPEEPSEVQKTIDEFKRVFE
ncbi:MAG: hypothetical protein IMF02_13565 [Proteobacteria bacterium]|nr:hypothetical protein [Pseudomonadota bacterium]